MNLLKINGEISLFSSNVHFYTPRVRLVIITLSTEIAPRVRLVIIMLGTEIVPRVRLVEIRQGVKESIHLLFLKGV